MVELAKLTETLTELINSTDLPKRLFAKSLGVSTAAPYSWLDGSRYPRTDVFARICNMYDLTPNEMFGLPRETDFEPVDAERVNDGLANSILKAENLGRTPRERLEAINLRANALSCWKSQKSPFQMDLLVMVMNATNTTPDELFYGEGLDEAEIVEDLTGVTFDNLEVIGAAETDENGRTQWRCKCLLCGSIVERSTADLKSYGDKNCGCEPVRAKKGCGVPGVSIPLTFICVNCGREIINESGTYHKTYCTACRRERIRRSAQKSAEKAREAKKLASNAAAKPKRAATGLFAGLCMSDIEGLARENGMSYGRYRSTAEYLGRLDVKNALGGATTA